MTFSYAARGTYSAEIDGWEKYIEWSGLASLTELVSLDSILNEDLIEFDDTDEACWACVVLDDSMITGFYTSLEYVLRRVESKANFNLLAVVVEPAQECCQAGPAGFEFIGYDLLDQSYDISALTNCGGFAETFAPSDQNEFGLLSNYDKACNIKQRLLENNPDEYHADTNLIAVWRHQTIGR